MNFCHYLRFLLMQFQAKYSAHPIGSHEAKMMNTEPSLLIVYNILIIILPQEQAVNHRLFSVKNQMVMDVFKK